MYNTLLYKKSPVFIQNILISIKGLIKTKIRSNKRTKKLLEVILSHEKNKDKLEKYQETKLQLALKNSRNNTLFYSEIIDNQLDSFSYINKQDILEAPSSFFSKQPNTIKIKGQTSGTTGTPLSLYQSVDSVIAERAFANRHRRWAGFKNGDKRAWIRGDLIVPLIQQQAPFWRYSYFENLIMLSSFHMTNDALPQYINAMVDFGVDIIQAYPSSITTLAKYLESIDEYYPAPLKSVITSSESLSQDDKLLIEKRFRCKVFDWYGLFERVAAIGSCEHGRYHILTDYSRVELLPAGEVDGKKRAEIIGTNFNNSLYPLIRYKTGDHVIISNEQNCPCGRIFPIIDSIEGREVAPLYTAKGLSIYALDQCSKGVKGVIGCQYIQKTIGEVIVHVIPGVNFTQNSASALKENIIARFGTGTTVKVIRVNQLHKTKNGKVIQAISLVDKQS